MVGLVWAPLVWAPLAIVPGIPHSPSRTKFKSGPHQSTNSVATNGKAERLGWQLLVENPEQEERDTSAGKHIRRVTKHTSFRPPGATILIEFQLCPHGTQNSITQRWDPIGLQALVGFPCLYPLQEPEP